MNNKLTWKERKEISRMIDKVEIICYNHGMLDSIEQEIHEWVEQKKILWQEEAIRDFLKPNSGELMKGFKGDSRSADDKVLKSIKH